MNKLRRNIQGMHSTFVLNPKGCTGVWYGGESFCTNNVQKIAELKELVKVSSFDQESQEALEILANC